MARPFARKQKADEDTAPSAADEFAQFFSNDPRPDDPTDDTPAASPAEQPAPAVSMEEQSAAGWYPDTKDPGLMRYWDGFHLTGQTMRVGPPPADAPEPGTEQPVAGPESSTGQPTVAPEPSKGQPTDAPEPSEGVRATAVIPPNPSGPPARYATDLLAPDLPLLGSRLLPGAEKDPGATPVQSQDSAPVPLGPSTPQEDVPVAEDEESGPEATSPDEAEGTGASGRGSVASPPPEPPVDTTVDQTNNWAERTEQAVTKAQATGTPEAWQEAARAASVVSEMAQTMRAAADIRQSAEQMDQAAEDAQRKADEAEEAAAEAQRAVQETAKAAREAAEAAATASRKAEEAKQKAERAIEATPRVADRAKGAAQAAADAKRRAQLAEEIVARAHQADTPEAWSEALRSTERAAESEAREGRFPGT
jgi:hypothetical protein